MEQLLESKWEVEISSYQNCVKSGHIRSYSGPYSIQMRKNTNQNNSEYRHSLRNPEKLFEVALENMMK